MWCVSAILLLTAACRKDEAANPVPSTGGGGVKSNNTEWDVTDLVRNGDVVISASNAVAQNIYFQLRENNVYISDNGVNECNGRFTTDKISKIDFDEAITCTQVAGDLDGYTQFKDVLRRDVGSYTVNKDTTVLTLLRDATTFIRLKRRK